MANPELVEKLKEGVEVWNKWRADFRGEVDLEGANLLQADLGKVDLSRANLREANLREANLREANLSGAHLRGAKMNLANLTGAHLHQAVLKGAELIGAKVMGADLREADFGGAVLFCADFTEAKVGGANLSWADLQAANLSHADLSGAKLYQASMVQTNLAGSNLSGCLVYGISAWDLEIDEDTNQSDLVVTPVELPTVTVDDLEIAQFIYLLPRSDKLKRVIDTVGSKGVLILGRFTDERLDILHAIRDELRKRQDLLPIMFDFDPQAKKTTIETLLTLAHMSRFVIADLTDAKAVVQELTKVVDALPSVPIKMLLQKSRDMPSMSDSFLIKESVLKPVYRYTNRKQLLVDLDSCVIGPANDWAEGFEKRLAELRRDYVPWQNGRLS